MSAERDGGSTASSPLGSVQRSLLLKTFPGFVDLTAEDLAILGATTRERFFREGAVLLAPGVPVQAFYLVLDGSVQMYLRGQPTQRFGPRSSIGGIASLTQDPEGAHAIALEDTLALEMDREDMADVFEDHFSILLGVLRAVARALREALLRAGGIDAAMDGFDTGGVDLEQRLGLVERIWLMRQSTTFAQTSIDVVADLAHDAVERRYRAGQIIWTADELADWSLTVVAGAVRCEPEQGDPFRFGPGYVAGGVDSLAAAPRSYVARAESDVLGLRLSRAALFDVLEDHPAMALELMRNMARGLTATFDRLSRAQAVAEQGSAEQAPGADEL